MTKSNSKGYLLGTDGSVKDAAPKLSLAEMYKAIGCSTVQPIDLNHGEMWLDEEGKMHDLEPNRLATSLFQAKYGAIDFIVGNVYLRVHHGWVFNGTEIVKAR